MISHFSALWGMDPASDIARLAKAYESAKHEAGLLMVPSYPLLNLDGLRRYDFRNTPHDNSAHDFDYSMDLVHLLKFAQIFLPDCFKTPARLKTNSNELLIQVDNAYSRLDAGSHAPLPLNYYRYVLETRYWEKVTLVDWGPSHSPVTEKLIAIYPKIMVFQGSVLDAWNLLVRSCNAVIGASSLAQALSLHDAPFSIKKKRIWVAKHIRHTDLANSHNREVNEVEVNNYFDLNEWRSSNRQRTILLEHEPSNIVDVTRWKFTETERCRSFKFCQSCRDTGSAGKLWRSVIQQRFDVPTRDWDCPHGWNWGGKPNFLLRLKKRLKLGTVVKKTTTALGVKPCTECAKRGAKMDGDRG